MQAQDTEIDADRIGAHLAAEFMLPKDVVTLLYERERATLAADARIASFLHIFAMRNVQALLRRRETASDRRNLDSPTGSDRQAERARNDSGRGSAPGP